MATDYALPPFPPRIQFNLGAAELLHKWSQQCAEAARARLLERIAELEAELARVTDDAKRNAKFTAAPKPEVKP